MSNDYFRFRQFTVYQSRCAMKVGTDGTLLGAWAKLPGQGKEAQPVRPRILDIGTGTGLIALMMSQRYPDAEVWGIDIDRDAVVQATQNVADSPFAHRIHICEADVCNWQAEDTDFTPASGFDAIVSNPPYFIDSLTCPDEQRTAARHTASLSYGQLMKAARKLLKSDGKLSIIIPNDCRRQLESAAILEGFFIQRICGVRTTLRKPPKRFLLQFGLHSENQLSEEIVIGSYEYRKLTQDFYLS